MSVTSNALVWYGAHLLGTDGYFVEKNWYEALIAYDPDNLEYQDDYEWQEHYASMAGLPSPKFPYEGNEHIFKAYWDQKYELVKEAVCTIDMHGHPEGCPAYFVAVASSLVTAGRGYPKQLNTLVKEADWDDQLKQFCAFMGLRVDGTFEWWLASYADF